MKNLTKIIILVVLVAFATESFAQKFGVKAGLNLSNMTVKDDDDNYDDDFKSKIGFQFGPVVEFPFSDMLSLETGLLLSTKGYKSEDSGTDWESKSSVNLMYLDIPINLRVGFDVGSMKIYGSFGPYVGIGLSGKVKWEYTEDGITESDNESINFGSDEYNEVTDEEGDDLKRTDFGINIGAGAIINNFEVGVNYGLGLANLSIYTDDGMTMNNKVLSITVAYKFGK